MLFIESLQKYHAYLGKEYTFEFPTNSGNKVTLDEISQQLTKRLINLFLPDKRGNRPSYTGQRKFQTDPLWKNYILFHEYFNGDSSKGLGANHQTGWTSIITHLVHFSQE